MNDDKKPKIVGNVSRPASPDESAATPDVPKPRFAPRESLLRYIKGDSSDLKDVIYQCDGHGFYVELYWRRADMATPIIETNLFDTRKGAAEARLMALMLNSAAIEAEKWKALNEKSAFWISTLTNLPRE